ncbi:TRAP transporter permease [Bacillus pumilus]|uniref:TRAP transporter permease n=1 Tax=Bacillus TaxID=1386 RepID=UPI002041C9FC|nr:TRAP transporter permease [Bacillus pumilus]MCM3035769.1 TRAP transporter permease [Bacillus pumilus]
MENVQSKDQPESARRITIRVILLISIMLSLFHLFTGGFGVLTAMIQRNVHLTVVLLLVFLIKPLANKKLRWLDTLCIIISISSGIYIFYTYDQLLLRVGAPNAYDMFFGITLIIVILEAARRVTGFILPLIGLLFLLYAYFGHYFPSILKTSDISLERIISLMYLSTEGLWGTSLGIAATFIALFIIFGAFLNTTGAGKVFIDLAFIIGGRFKGGPAKVSVISSALMATVSGSAVANVSSTGQFTIPLMKKVGFKPRMAASIEAVASAGGSIMPPVMGAGAFIMAELTGISYGKIILAALIPGILYFLSVFLFVDFDAGRAKMKGIEKKELPVFKEVFWKGFHLYIGLGTLIYLLVVLNASPMFAAFWSIVALVISYIAIYFRKIDWKFFLEALEQGAKGMLLISMACAIAGIVVGVINLTGTAVTLTSLLMNLGQNSILLTLFLTMIACVIMGMGLPSTAAYIIVGVLTAPALIDLGIDPLLAHMFIYYFASLAPIIPPVALASYTAAGIAGSDPLRTSFTSARVGLVSFIIPYMFVFGPELLGQGSAVEIALAVTGACIGVIFFAAALTGWLKRDLFFYERILSFGGASLLVHTGLLTDLIGIGIIAVLLTSILIRTQFNEKPQDTYEVNQ